jgi:Transposase IS116/IS110/IS902 family
MLSWSVCCAGPATGARSTPKAASAATIQAALASQQLEAPAVLTNAYGQVVAAAVAVIGSLSEQLAGLEAALTAAFGAHPDAGIVQSQPGLGVVLGARVLAEFGDDPDRYAGPKARKAYAGTAPITRASGLRQVVLARAVGNRRLTTACHLWAFAALTGSPGARRYYDYYDALRARGTTHHQALRALGNRLVGILHGCLRHRRRYDEQVAWPAPPADAAA